MGFTNSAHRLTTHHRLPRELGGTNAPENKSEVERYLHDAYHLLFGTLPAPEQARRFEYRYSLWGDNRNQTREQQDRIKDWLNGSRHHKHERNRWGLWGAWKILFSKMDCPEMLTYLNSTWTDPAWTFHGNPVQGPNGMIVKIRVEQTIITPPPQSQPQAQYARIFIPTSIRQWQPQAARTV